jgi:hypothetical protein
MRGCALWGASMAMLSVERLIRHQRSASSAGPVATATAAPSRLTNAVTPQAQNGRKCVVIGTQGKRADRAQDGQAWTHLTIAVPSHAHAGENDRG